MSHETLDLDISHYSLDDLAALFKIPVGFDEAHLKQAKTIVLKTHPDKSGLDPRFFLFYKKAYDRLKSVWDFRKRGDVGKGNDKNTDYSVVGDDEKRELLNEMFERDAKLKDKRLFNRWFNDLFDRNKLPSEAEEKGYDDWLRSSDPTASAQVTMETMGAEFERQKSQARALVLHKDIQDIYCANSVKASELGQDAPTSFDSDLFSALAYQDLRQAHTETVIPVTHEDYENKLKFKSVNEYISYRGQQDTKPLSEAQALNYLKTREKNDEDRSTRVAYELAKQTELAERRNQDFWASIQLLRDK
jgi:curved DNA-binding protein CbpA